jgi:phage terminase large subunit-like protein
VNLEQIRGIAAIVNPDAIAAERRRRSGLETRKLAQFFPDAGPYRRELYPKHFQFFHAGSAHMERLFMAANRVGKSEAGAFEATLHLTGLYPEWWPGRRFESATEGWACGTNSGTTFEIVQGKLLGRLHGEPGMIPPELIVHKTALRGGAAGAVHTVWVKHVTGKFSTVTFKSYEAGRKSFEGAAKDWIWCDEEPPEDCYAEMLTRLLTTKGCMYTTFTPLQGMSEVVKMFIEPANDEMRAVKWYVQAGWGDVPHLDEAAKKTLIGGWLPYQIKARTLGEPSLGQGAIYPIAEDDVLTDTVEIPASWRRAYAMDVGWNRTAVLWMAENPGNGNLVFYDEHYQGQGEPASHAAAVMARGDWIHGVMDPAALGSSQIDGQQMMELYGRMGLKLVPAVNAVEAGITDVWSLLVSGRLKAMRHLQNWRREFSRYHRDQHGKVVKRDDHLMDCTRYSVTSGRLVLGIPPVVSTSRPHAIKQPGGWMR